MVIIVYILCICSEDKIFDAPENVSPRTKHQKFEPFNNHTGIRSNDRRRHIDSIGICDRTNDIDIINVQSRDADK